MPKLANYTSRYRASIIASTYKSWVKSGQKAADVGCGTGVVANYLADNLNLKITGCDIDEYLISKIPFKKMSKFSKIPFKNKSFDIVMFNDVLHHTDYKNQITLLKEATRVGKKILIFELKPTLLGRIGDFILNKIHNPNMDIPFTYRSQKEWEEVFKDLNFKISKKTVDSQRIFYPFLHVGYCLTK